VPSICLGMARPAHITCKSLGSRTFSLAGGNSQSAGCNSGSQATVSKTSPKPGRILETDEDRSRQPGQRNALMANPLSPKVSHHQPFTNTPSKGSRPVTHPTDVVDSIALWSGPNPRLLVARTLISTPARLLGVTAIRSTERRTSGVCGRHLGTSRHSRRDIQAIQEGRGLRNTAAGTDGRAVGAQRATSCAPRTRNAPTASWSRD